MKAWFFGLQPRERWIVALGAAAAAIILLWSLVLRPLDTQTVLLRTSVELKQRLLIEVAQIEGAQPGGVAPTQGAQQTLAVIVSNTAASYGLGQPRTRQNGPSGIDVTLQGVSFDALAVWLVALHDAYAIDVETASLTNARETGLVNGQISLHRL